MHLILEELLINADYVAGDGTDTLTFEYEVVGSDIDLDGIAIAAPIAENGGNIKDNGGNDAALGFLPPSTPTILVNGDIPVVTNVSAPISGNYGLGQELNFVIIF